MGRGGKKMHSRERERESVLEKANLYFTDSGYTGMGYIFAKMFLFLQLVRWLI